MHRTWRGLARASACWNWKCALLSGAARSAIYCAALTRSFSHRGLEIVTVEIAYVAVTAGIYAGMQQRALRLRPRLFGSLIVVLGVPGLAQSLDWLAHRLSGSGVPMRATLAVSVFALISALFHLHVMRRGAFLTGHEGRSLSDDFRRMPKLVLGFVVRPFVWMHGLAARLQSEAQSEAVL